jgi:hypothetical protein
MEKHDRRFVVYLALLTIGFALPFIGIIWLFPLSGGLVVLSFAFSSRLRKTEFRRVGSSYSFGYVVLFICIAAFSALEGIRAYSVGDTERLDLKELPWWFGVGMGVLWLSFVFREWRLWRANRSARHDA